MKDADTTTRTIEVKSFRAKALTLDNCEVLASIARTAFAEHAKSGFNMRDTSITGERFLADVMQRDDTVSIAYVNGIPEGYAIGHLAHDGRFLFMKAESLAVNPTQRGASLGRTLMQAREAWARSQGARYTLLDTCNRAERTKEYHHRHGYKNWYYYHWDGKNYISIFMRKDLGEPYPATARFKRLLYSWIKINARFTRYGQERWSYKLAKRLARKISRSDS